jgi:hypothetical protein
LPLSASYPAAVAPLPFLLDPSAGRDGGARAIREKEPGFAAKTARNKGLGAGLVPARGSGEFATNYQDAVKGVLTLRRPAAMGAQVRGFGPHDQRTVAFAGPGQSRGVKTLPTASATIKGYEVMRMIRKRQCLMLEPGAAGEIRFVNRLFRLAA